MCLLFFTTFFFTLSFCVHIDFVKMFKNQVFRRKTFLSYNVKKIKRLKRNTFSSFLLFFLEKTRKKDKKQRTLSCLRFYKILEPQKQSFLHFHFMKMYKQNLLGVVPSCFDILALESDTFIRFIF